MILGLRRLFKHSNFLPASDSLLPYPCGKSALSQPRFVQRNNFSRRDMARTSGYSSREISHLLSGKVVSTPQAIARLQSAINALEKEKQETAEILSRARQAIQKDKIGHRKLAVQASIDPPNLYNTI